MVRKKAMDEVGVFDEKYFFFFEETDWAYRMRSAGWKVCFVPGAEIIHAQGKTVGSGLNSRTMFYRSRYIFLKKWHPHSYPFFYLGIFLRLLINTFLSVIGVIFTLGFKNDISKKVIVYIQLIIWHLRGCPKIEETAGQK
jgi:GT2 family glycosyltransferase